MRDTCIAAHGGDDAVQRSPAETLDGLDELVAPRRIGDRVDHHLGEDAGVERPHRFIGALREPPAHAVDVPPEPRVGGLGKTVERSAQDEI